MTDGLDPAELERSIEQCTSIAEECHDKLCLNKPKVVPAMKITSDHNYQAMSFRLNSCERTHEPSQTLKT